MSLDPLSFGKFDVEHALNIYAYSYATLPAQALYDPHSVAHVRKTSESFHIYVIGHTPVVEQRSFDFRKGLFHITVIYMGKELELTFPVPPELKFVRTEDTCHFEDPAGEIRMIDPLQILLALGRRVGGCPFKVQYIGQAYGDDGSRDAIDRLLKHETLQKIAIRGSEAGQVLQIVLLELHTDNRVIFAFLPNAEIRDKDGARAKMGIDKLFGTTEAERVSLYEAALIRHFSPPFNKEFKNSFPSTNLKLLQDCYDKDFLALTAEICFDEFPYAFYSEAVAPKYEHIITYDLQNDDQRKVFFHLGL